MKNSKFFRLYATLSKEEIKEFDKHLRKMQPKQQQLFKIIDYFKRYGQDVESDKLNKDVAIKKIFKTTANKRHFNNLLSDFKPSPRRTSTLGKI